MRRRRPQPGRPDDDAHRRIALAVALVVCWSPVCRADRACSPTPINTHERHRVLRQQQRHLSPATTCASWACRSARSTRSNRSRSGRRSRSGSTANTRCPPTPRRSILSPTLVTARAIQLTPAYTGGPGDGRRRGHPAGAHRGAGRVGRLARATGEAHRHAAADRARRGQHAGRVHQHRRRQPARPGRQHPRHGDQAVAGVVGARRPQQRHLLARSRTCRCWCRRCRAAPT